MHINRRWNPLHLIASAALIASVACGDRSTAPARRTAPADDASRVISDGAHGGNSDVFFLPPLAGNPSGAAGYGDPFQAGLPVVFIIRDLTAAGQPVFKTLPATASGSDQHYQANWDTKNPALNTTHTYRIEVHIGSRMPAWADVDVVSNGSQLKNVNTDEYIGLQDGRTLPLKVRVETGWACVNKASCVAEVVPSTIPAGQTKIIKSNDQMNALKLEGTWNAGGGPVIVVVENVTSQQGGTGCSQGLTIMLSKESCIKFTTDPPVALTTAAVVGTCMANAGDGRQMILKYDVGETAKFLEDVAPPIVCPEGTASVSPNAGRAMRLATAAMNKVSKAFRTITGTKAAYAIDLGVGGRLEIGDDFSFFGLGLPSSFEAAAGQGQTGVIGKVLPVAPTVRAVALHHHGDDPLYVDNLNVTCTLIGASGALVVGLTEVNTAAATNNGDGTYTCPEWKMPGTASANTLRISSNKHDASFFFPGEEGYTLMSGTFDFTATSALPAGVINSINLATSTLIIGGPNVNYTANLTNPGPSLPLVTLQGVLQQGATLRGAGGSNVLCGAGSGVFPPGACAHNFSAVASNTAGGIGTLVPGAATLHFELSYFDGVTTTLLDSEDVPVTLVAPVTSVSIAPAGAALDIGQTVSLVATVVATPPTSTAVTWASSNAAVATVNASGVVTAVAAGTANVIATSVADPTKTATAPIVVTAVGGPLRISKLTITDLTLLLPSNPSGTWTATLANTTGDPVLGLTLQGDFVQGANTHPAGGILIDCPAGGCSQSFSYSTSNMATGIGPLVPGAAMLRVRLLQGATELDSKLIPVTLVAP